MKAPKALMFLALLLGNIPLWLKAGVLLSLKDAPEVDGRLSVKDGSIHVEGPSTVDVDLTNVLEADFTNEPFHLDYFRSKGETGNNSPPGWTTRALGPGEPAGAATFEAGTLTLTGIGSKTTDSNPDEYFFAGVPWTGDGQWTAEVQKLDPASSPPEVGLAVRNSLDAGSKTAGAKSSQAPTWIRLTRCGFSLDTSVSSDGKVWETVREEAVTELATQTWVGFTLNSRQPDAKSTAVLNEIAFTPQAAQSETVPPGVLLKSGSFLAADSYWFSPPRGSVTYKGHAIDLASDQVAATVWHPVARQQLAETSSQAGIIVKNGDFLASAIQLVQARMWSGMAQMYSIELGYVAYYPDRIRACVVQPVVSQPSDYEVRLRDGSNLRAKSFHLANGQLMIQEVSGIALSADPAEIAQVRAGLSRVEPLISLAWKVSGPTPGTVLTWSGPNQEQILVVPAGTSVEFPLPDRFRGLAMRLAVAPGAPANATAMLRVLAGGQEVGRSPPFKAGDQPGAIELAVADPRSVTLAVDSAQAGTSLLLIDPVAIRDK